MSSASTTVAPISGTPPATAASLTNGVPSSTKGKGTLFALDFDHTIVDANSDTWIIRVLEDKVLPSSVKSTYDGSNWTQYMNNVFSYMHEQDVPVQDIIDCVKSMSLAPGMSNLIQKISRRIQCETAIDQFLIISDSNDLFISTYMASLSPPVQPTSVITNKSLINSNNNNLLQIQPYENQTSCSICAKNLCKGTALLKYIEDKGPFESVVYIGDGRNDICPCMKLTAGDLVFPRKGYALEKLVKEFSVKAKIMVWVDAESIVDSIFGE